MRISLQGSNIYFEEITVLLFYETLPPGIPSDPVFGGFGGALIVEFDSVFKVRYICTIWRGFASVCWACHPTFSLFRNPTHVHANQADSNITFFMNQAKAKTGARAGGLYLFANGTFIVER